METVEGRTTIKRILGNALVVLMIVWSVNLLAAVLVDLQYRLEQWLVPVSKKASRPSLPDRAKAETIFKEFSLLRTRYVSFIAWSREPFAGRYTTVNEEGDRVHPATTDDPIGHVRFFGGSTTWSKGVADDETMPAYYNALHPEWRVHNHGESGFVSGRLGSAPKPDNICRDDPVHAKRVAHALIENWKLAKAIAEAGGATFHAAFQPVLPVTASRVDYLEKDDYMGQTFVYPIIREIIEREGLDWAHDFSDAFDEVSQPIAHR